MKVVHKVGKSFTLEQVHECMEVEGVSNLGVAVEDGNTTDVYKIEKVYKIEGMHSRNTKKVK